MVIDRGPTTTFSSAAELFAARYTALVRLAGLITGSQTVAEELVQDAFLQIHLRWDGIANPEAYVRRAVVNAGRSALRRQAVAQRHAPALAQRDGSADAHDEVWDVIQRLPDRQRTAVVLRYYADWAEGDIAEAMGCRPATVRTHLHRAMQTLRKEVER